MGASAQRWIDDDDEALGASADAGALRERPCALPRGSGTTPAAPEDRSDIDHGGDPGWNVLAEELVSFPPSTARRLLEVAGPPESGPSAARRGTAAARVSASDRRNAEAWLDRELVHLRAVADRAYPVAPSLGRTPARRPLVAESEQRRSGIEVGTARPARRSERAARGLRQAEPRRHATAAGQLRPALQVHPARSARAAAPLHRGAAFPELRGLRRLLPGVATLAVLVALWAGIGALSQIHRPQPVAI